MGGGSSSASSSTSTSPTDAALLPADMTGTDNGGWLNLLEQ